MQNAASDIERAERPQAETLIRACLRGENPPWPGGAGPGLDAAVVERCDFHGVAPLVCQWPGVARSWPRETVERLRERTAAAAVWEAHHQRLLSRLLAALAARGTEPVLFKGTALAYACYEDPALRIRGDTDLLIPPSARDEADAALAALGFERPAQVSGEFISYQAGYVARDPLGLAHVVDLHWRVSNAEVLSRLFGHSELRSRAVPLPALGPDARAAGSVDALMIACLHREVHGHSPYWVDGVAHLSPDRLIWLWDIHLLAGGLDDARQAELVRLAREKGLARVCRDGLARAAEALGTRLPEGLLAGLDPGGRHETPRSYLRAGTLRREYMNVRALPGLGPRLRLLRELAFPPADYMRARHGHGRPDWLPWHYLRRALTGAAARLRGPQGGRGGGRWSP